MLSSISWRNTWTHQGFLLKQSLRVSFTWGKEAYGGGIKTIQEILVTADADVIKEVFASEEIRRISLQAFFDWGSAGEVDTGQPLRVSF